MQYYTSVLQTYFFFTPGESKCFKILSPVGEDRQLLITDVESGKVLRNVFTKLSDVERLHLACNETIVIVNSNKQIWAWDVKTGKAL